MRFTLVLTIIIFTALVTYAKLLAVAEAPPHVYTNTAAPQCNSCQQALNSSAKPTAQSN